MGGNRKREERERERERERGREQNQNQKDNVQTKNQEVYKVGFAWLNRGERE